MCITLNNTIMPVSQATVMAQATSRAGNDDSFYSYMDGNRGAARMVHSQSHVGAFSSSPSIFAVAMSVTAGAMNFLSLSYG